MMRMRSGELSRGHGILFLFRTTLPALAFVLVAATVAVAQVPKMVFSIGSSGTVGGIPVENEDLLLCDPVPSTPPVDDCNWSLYFDGSAAGLNSKIKAVDIFPNGNLLMRVNADSSIPDIPGVKKKDLVLFTPVDPTSWPYLAGTWKLYLDGNKVKDSSDGKVWDAVDILTDGSCENNDPPTCDLLLSLSLGGTLGGVSFANEDIIRCQPTAWSVGGTIEACDYSLFLDSSQLGLSGNLFAFDLLASDTLLLRSSNVGLGHQTSRDILRYVGTFGAAPAGIFDLFFDGSEAGLAGEIVESFAVFPDVDGDDVPDGVDNCPDDSNPGQEDFDSDGFGDVCDVDPDCPDPTNLDGDGDGVGDACDICLSCVDPTNTDTDGDGECDVCDVDPDCFDPTNLDGDGDGVGDACDICLSCVDPTNTDSDGDGECDVCDYCPFRADPTCECGDAIVDPPSETCDLGSAQNGQPGSLCSAICQVVGSCTVSGTTCETAADCPPGEGCCGNDIVEGDEECDDGNSVPDDLCDNSCTFNPQGIPILGCEDVFGPHLVSAFVKIAKFKDTNRVIDPGFDKWKSKGDFNLGDGQTIDADTEEVTLIFSQAGPATLYTAVLPPGSFTQSSSPTRPTWKFIDKEADVPGAIGWRKAKFFLRLNKIKNNVNGRDLAIDIDTEALGAPIELRQTIRVGDDCATTVLTCEEKSNGKLLKCNSEQAP